MKKEQLISVIIAERPYRLSISSEEEEQLFRESGKLIEERIKEYASNFAFRDKQDLLAMVTLQFAVEILKLETIAQNHEVLKQQLTGIDRLLDESLLDKS